MFKCRLAFSRAGRSLRCSLCLEAAPRLPPSPSRFGVPLSAAYRTVRARVLRTEFRVQMCMVGIRLHVLAVEPRAGGKLDLHVSFR